MTSRAGTSTFDDPNRYRKQFRGADIDLVFTAPGDFKARLTWLDLPNFSLLGAQDNGARIASISFEPARAFISFPDPPGAAIWNGIELQPGEIVLHRPGSRIHDRGNRTNRWNYISVDPSHMQAVGTAIAGRDWERPASDLVLKPPARAAIRLRGLHAKACELAESSPEMLLHREVSRAIEQDLIRVLVECLSARPTVRTARGLARHIRIMAAFEDAIAANLKRDVAFAELLDAVGVPERTLRLCCGKVLGVGPRRYLQLQRLNKARIALQQADPKTTFVAEIAQRYRFSELGRFAASYRSIFGEMPSDTLCRRTRPRDRSFAANA